LHKVLDLDGRTLLQTKGKVADVGTLKGPGDLRKGESQVLSFLFQSPAPLPLDSVS
jgi:hypothetical protein